MSHTTESLRRRRLVFLVTKKVEEKRERGGHHDFRRFFCLSVPKFIGYPSVFRKISGIENLYGQKGGGGGSITIYLRKTVVSQYQKLCRTLPCFRQFLVSKNFMDERGPKEGVITIFRRKFVVSQNLVGEPFGVSEKFGHQKI